MGLEKIGMSLAQRTAPWVKAAGITSVLQIKPISPTQIQGLRFAPSLADDVARCLGVINSNGTIEFPNQKAAIEYMRTQCTKALQGKNPCEHTVSIRGARVIGENTGTVNECWSNNIETGVEIAGHGHPDTYAKGCTTAPSILDYYSLMSTKSQMKELVFNSNGEIYSMTKIPNALVKNKKIMGCYHEIDILNVKHYFKTQPKSIQAKLNKAIQEKDLQTFEEMISKYMPTSPTDTTKELTELTHTFWLKYGKKLGVEVDTNFSNFKTLA